MTQINSVVPAGLPQVATSGGGVIPNGVPNDDLIVFSNGATFDPTPAEAYAPEDSGYSQAATSAAATPAATSVASGLTPEWQDRFGALFAQHSADGAVITEAVNIVGGMGISAPELSALYAELSGTAEGQQTAAALIGEIATAMGSSTGAAQGAGVGAGVATAPTPGAAAPGPMTPQTAAATSEAAAAGATTAGGVAGLTPELEAAFTELFTSVSGDPRVAADIVAQLNSSGMTSVQLEELGNMLISTEEGAQLIQQAVLESQARLGLATDATGAATTPLPGDPAAPGALPATGPGGAVGPDGLPLDPNAAAQAPASSSPNLSAALGISAAGVGILGASKVARGQATSFAESIKVIASSSSSTGADKAKLAALLNKVNTAPARAVATEIATPERAARFGKTATNKLSSIALEKARSVNASPTVMKQLTAQAVDGGGMVGRMSRMGKVGVGLLAIGGLVAAGSALFGGKGTKPAGPTDATTGAAGLGAPGGAPAPGAQAPVPGMDPSAGAATG